MPEDRDSTPEDAPTGPFARVRAALERSARMRWIVRGVAALVAVAIFLALPAYLASKPEFLRRYPKLDAQYRTWETSAHVKATCQSCHVPPGTAAQAKYSLRMLGEFYLSIITRPETVDAFPKPTNDACSSCHIDLRAVSPSGDLNIPHRAHVTVLGMECVKCHANLAHQAGPEGSEVPPMEMCLECHDGTQADNACSACHTQKAAPPSHSEKDWTFTHAEKQAGGECEKCHKWRDDWCADCHARRPSSHGDKWRSVHRDRVAQHRNCEACHEGSFCVRCHGEVPSLNYDPALKRVE